MTGYRMGRGKTSPLTKIIQQQNLLMIAREARKEHNHMPNINRVVVPLMYGQVRVEFEISSEDDETLTLPEIKSHIDWLISEGFQPATYGASREDNVGEKGKVVSVKPVEGTKMYEVTGKLDTGKEFKWREFNATSFRINDRFIVIRNERGFKAGELIIEPDEQTRLAF